MGRLRKIVVLVALAALAAGLVGSRCEGDKPGDEADPLKAKAREKYAEGRRLFLTCDPNNYDQAQQLFKDAMAYWDDYPEALAAWSETMSMWYSFMIPEQLFQEAYSQAQRAVRLDPEVDAGYRAMADLYRHHRDPATGEVQTRYALDVIELALKIAPDSAENLYVQGSIYLALDPAKAIEVLSRARAVNPDLGKTYFNLASAYQTAGDKLMLEAMRDPSKLEQNKELISRNYEQAIAALQTYQRLVPGDLAGYCSLGIVYLHDGKTTEALQQFQETVSRNQKGDISQYRWKIMAYDKLAEAAEVKDHDLGSARLYMERALALAPKNAQTLSVLVRLTKALKDEKAAAEYQARLAESVKEMEMKEQAGPAAGPAAGSTAGPGSGSTADVPAGLELGATAE